jgi:hypothetical protein
MRLLAAVGLSVSLFASGARAEGKSELLFSCAIGAKQVSVAKTDKGFVYRFGTAAHSEVTLVGDPASGNIFQLRQRFTGPETQVRFTKGEFSYIVLSAEGNSDVGANSIAGVTVMRGLKSISFLTCARFTEFKNFDQAFAGVPEDIEAYSGM